MGILRADRITGLGGANAIKGSVEFRAEQNIQAEIVNGNADFNLGSGDFTIECWWNSGGDLSTDIDFVTLWNWGSNRQAWGMYYDGDTGQFGFIGDTTGSGGSNISYTQAAGFEKNKWYHLAIVRISNTLTLYKNGTSIGSNSSFNYTIYENTVDPLIIGGQMDGSSESSKIMRGFISNLRVIKGEGIYTGNFTPPTNELTVTPNTVLLACQSPGDILQEATGKKLVAYRRTLNSSLPVASRFTPNSPVGFSTTTDVGSQYGATFDGFTVFATSTYMVPPGGNTRERNRGRAIFSGGYGTSPSNYRTTIDYVQIQSLGNASVFGNLSALGQGEGSACASSTRAIHGGGGPSGAVINTMEFVTIASTSNTTDFGDLVVARRSLTALASDTRGIWAGGATPAMREEIDYATIATVGNAIDFGNLTDPRRNPAVGSIASTTRGVFAGGNPGTGPLLSDTIDYITIASTGNATDFGNMTQAMREIGGSSSSIRGLIAGGFISPANINNIEYITIATTGNAADFGDLNITVSGPSGTSNGTRALFAGGSNPYINSMEYVTIANLGNAADFGDLTEARLLYSGTSDSHGGLS